MKMQTFGCSGVTRSKLGPVRFEDFWAHPLLWRDAFRNPQISKTESFVTISNDFYLLTILPKFSTLDVFGNPLYAFGMNSENISMTIQKHDCQLALTSIN